jgi:hypothetical protein
MSRAAPRPSAQHPGRTPEDARPHVGDHAILGGNKGAARLTAPRHRQRLTPSVRTASTPAAPAEHARIADYATRSGRSENRGPGVGGDDSQRRAAQSSAWALTYPIGASGAAARHRPCCARAPVRTNLIAGSTPRADRSQAFLSAPHPAAARYSAAGTEAAGADHQHPRGLDFPVRRGRSRLA